MGTEYRYSGRRSYLKDFLPDGAGGYRYGGVVYHWPQGQTRRRQLLPLLCLGTAALSLQVAAGCLPAPGMDHSPLLILPYLFSTAAAVSVLWGMLRLALAGEELRAYLYWATVEALPRRSLLLFASSALVLLAEGAFFLLHRPQGQGLAARAFCLLQALDLCLALLIRKRAKGLAALFQKAG